jgi:hypothetical protein
MNFTDPKWLQLLIKWLSHTKLTRAQAADIILDAMGVMMFLAYLKYIKPPNWSALVAFLVILIFSAWSHVTSKPKTKAR